ncbi:MAG: Transcriptional activator of fatty acid utilization [Bogoriella megaspora]|nr:MAG: Transcriptional activator of fatty acid utilization [Bogoriella megaspora]
MDMPPTIARSSAPSSQTPGHPSFRSDQGDATQTEEITSPVTVGGSPGPGIAHRDKGTVYNTSDGTPSTKVPDAYAAQQVTHNGTYVQFMKPKFARAPIKEAGRVAYLGESSNLSLLVHDRHGTSDVVHYPLPENVRGTKSRMNELDGVEIEILHQRGAFLLPPRALCDELVEAFFMWIAPVVPCINRSRFMRRYRDPKNPPSLLLLQAMLLAGSRVCTNPQLMDSSGSTTPAAMTFYKRAKALYDANYEEDRVTIVQALILMGWYWEGPEGKPRDGERVAPIITGSDVGADVTKNVFYWSRVAIIVAQGCGMHRSVEGSQLSKQDKRLWKRIWWTLFTRDRSVAVALGRPVSINTDDMDVEMIAEDDFIEDELDRPAEYPPDPIHVQFFLNYVRLTEIMGLVLSQQYSVASKSRRTNAIDLTHSDMALADWLQNCPKEVYWERQRHHFWSALLHSNYYTTLCLLHRAHLPPAGSPKTNTGRPYAEEGAYPSRNIAYQAAGMITSIIENLEAHDEIRYTPAFIVYSLFSALIMHVYQMRSSNQQIVSATEQRMRICMNALREVSKVWLVAKMVHTLFESILGNKSLEERLQRAAGKRHPKARPNGNIPGPSTQKEDAAKRKFDEMDLNYPNGPPAAQVSYERSRPQTPAQTPSRELPPQQQQLPNVAQTSPPLRHNSDAFMGGMPSRGNTRSTTPFNPNFSYPSTPPELFLVTKNSPNISQDLWQNFQPDQLFPADTSVNFNHISPVQQNSFVDPQLQNQPMQMSPAQEMQHPPPGMQQIQTPNGMTHIPRHPSIHSQHQNEASGWAQFDAMNQHPPSGQAEDTWSNSSRGQGPVVPMALNVEDWFQFFGIPNGDMNGLNGTY